MALFSKKKKKKKSDKDVEQELITSLAKLKTKVETSENLDKTKDSFYKTLRAIFSKEFKLKHQFTYEELKNHVSRKHIPDDVKEKSLSLFDWLTDIEYANEPTTKEDLLKHITTAEYIIKGIKGGENKPLKDIEKKSIFSVVRSILPKNPKELPAFDDINTDTEEIMSAPLELPAFETQGLIPVSEVKGVGKTIETKLKEVDIHTAEHLASLPHEHLVETAGIKEHHAKKIVANAKEMTNTLDSLPTFTIKQKLNGVKKKQKGLKDDLTNVMQNIGKEQQNLTEEFEKLRETEKALDNQAKKIEDLEDRIPKGDSKKYDTRIAELKSNLDERVKEVSDNEKRLKDREKELEEKLAKVKGMESEVSHMAVQVNEDQKALFEKEKGLEEKEILLEKIKGELKQKNTEMLEQIENFKGRLEEKEKEFQLQQTTYEKREQELTREQARILSEKEEQSKLLEKEVLMHKDRLDEIKKMQRDVTQKYTQVNEDRKKLLEKEKDLSYKEKEIQSIKSELTTENKKALTEIDHFKNHLKERQKHFLALQEFYNQRENRLSVEESNLLDEKRRHVKFIENNLKKHKVALEKNIKITDELITKRKEKIGELEKGITETQKLLEQMQKDKDELESEIFKKEKYFKKMEDSLKSKGPELDKFQKNIHKREQALVDKEKKYEEKNQEIDNLNMSIEKRKTAIELNELEVKNIEKHVENIQLKLNQKERDIYTRNKKVDKYLEKYKKLKKDIRHGLRNRERELERKEANIDKKFKKAHANGLDDNKKLTSINEKLEKIYVVDPDLAKRERAILDSVEEYHPHYEGEPGTPAFLDILRLLNIAKVSLKEHDVDDAKNIYISINNLYEKLPPQEKEDAYQMITHVYKPKDRALVGKKSVIIYDKPKFNRWKDSNEESNSQSMQKLNIELLLTQLHEHLKQNDLAASGQIYVKLQEEYKVLSADDKDRYYPQIIKAYNLAMQKHIALHM